ncbi:uncharacterized protein Non2 isoform X10 [Macrobrachium rosenbergii]|uniref:uncharacterized protein Non2 isoform X10 n=1 Tax=Macrobrachium rosenbergii TaxID=79674 RepID=UPI0034D47BC3
MVSISRETLKSEIAREYLPDDLLDFDFAPDLYTLVPRQPWTLLVLEILKGADLDTLSAKKVRQQLEQKLGVDLSSRKKDIDEIIMADVEQANSHSEEEVSETEQKVGDDDDDDYEPGAKKVKKPKAKKRKASDDEDDSDEEWGKKKKVLAAESPKKAGGGGGGGRGKASAFTKSFKLSDELAAVVGADVMPRHEVVKKLWAVIKERNLQDPGNKQFAICDDQLFKVIGVKRFRTFGMMKHLKNHFLEAA